MRKAGFTVVIIGSCLVVGLACGGYQVDNHIVHPPIGPIEESDSGTTGSSGSDTNSGPPAGCTDCKLPKGFSFIRTSPDERCLQKRIDCMCGSPPESSLQGVCLYPITPIPHVGP